MKWFSSNQIVQINTQETQFVCFATSLFLHDLERSNCKCSSVLPVDSVKYLGIFFDSNMSWNTHLAFICSQLRKTACLMYGLKSLCSLTVRKQIAFALAYSALRYGTCCFYICSTFWKNKVDCILRSILKHVLYGTPGLDNKEVFRVLRMPDLTLLFKQTIVLEYIWSLQFCQPYTPVRDLRPRDRFLLPRTRTRFGEHVREYYVPMLLNSLPDDFFSMNSRRKIKNSLIDLHYRL